ncbi:MAG: MFS transporter [Planctomycetota bacterium]
MSESEKTRPDELSRDETLVRDEPRNLLVLAFYNVVLRASWIFKTESVIMPRFLDLIDGSGFVRGWLPLLNRTGQSVPPLLLADRLRRKPLKRKSMRLTSTLMGVCFLGLASAWSLIGEPMTGNAPVWIAPAFLLVYVTFFIVSGLNQLALGTLTGKLIRPDRRGRLLGLAGIVGSILSVTLAWFLLARWLAPPTTLPGGGYVLIFGFAGTGFVLAGLLTLPLREPLDTPDPAMPHRSMATAFRDAWTTIRTDQPFRRAATVAMLFISVQLLFPHFQAFGRAHLPDEREGFHLMLWVIAQNAAVGAFSWGSGFIADRFGNRLAIRIQIFLSTLTPLIALLLTSELIQDGVRWFWVAFFFLGLVPVTMKSFVNYTLELTNTQNHPRYVSTMSLSFAVPFVLSPLAGSLIDSVGFEPVFLAISGAIGLAGLLTFRMTEPRHT